MKPGIPNQYQKDAYKDISNYYKRDIKYFDDKVRYLSVYDKDYLKEIKESNYSKESNKNEAIFTQKKYDYSNEPCIQDLLDEGKTKNEERVKARLYYFNLYNFVNNNNKAHKAVILPEKTSSNTGKAHTNTPTAKQKKTCRPSLSI